MPEPVIYVRGFGGAPRVEALATSSDVLADLTVVAGLSDDDVNALSKRLSEATGFFDPNSLLEAVRGLIGDEGAAQSVRRVLRNLGPKDVRKLLDTLSKRRAEEDFPLDEGTLERLHKLLPVLLQPYPALTRFEKAERLATLTGQQLESVELICDVRPIFDETRQQIEGMMPYTRLHIVATDADGLPKSFEAELTQQQVHDLAEKASKATVKLDVLRASVEKWMPGALPDLPLTRVPRREPSDA